MTLVVSPKKLTVVLALVVSGLMIAHLGSQTVKYVYGSPNQLGFARVLDLNGENTLHAWYQSSALLLCAGLLALIGLAKRTFRDRFAGHWLVLAAIFLFLSMDETASLHDLSTPPLRSALTVTGYLRYTWVIPGSLFVLVVLLSYRRFLGALPPTTRGLFLLAGCLYVGGAAGIELIGGQYDTLYGQENLPYAMLVLIEEGLEMTGIVLFAFALSAYLRCSVKEVHIVFDESVSDRRAGPDSYSKDGLTRMTPAA
jgi:hypothetical protein